MTADTLTRALTSRALAAGAASAPPVVVPLGTADALAGERDPHAERRPRATVHLTAREVLVGPWGGEGDPEAACGRCLAMRWQRLRSKSERDALETGTAAPVPVGTWPLLPDHALDAVWALYEAAVLTPHPGAPRQVTRLDLATLRTDTHRLLAEPLCPHCAPAEAAPPAPPALVPRPKPDPGAYRLRPAASYPLDDGALANPVCGVLGAGTWLNVTSPTTSPVAGTVFMRGYAGLTDVTWSGQANSYRASRDLAFLEGLERYAGTHRRTPAPPRVEAYSALRERGVPAVDPVECGTYAPETYRDDPMVRPFDPDRPIPWVEGYSLRDGRTVLVPARLVYYSAGLHADNFVFECSNGCAIGSTLEEAVLFGLLELIERDAFLLGWFGGARLTEIDLATCGVGTVRAMADRAALQGYDIHVFDNRADLAIPVVTGLAVRRDGGPGALSFGAAAALDPASAIESALSEVLTYIPHLPRQVSERRAELEAMADDFEQVRHLKDHAQLYGLPRMKEHARGYLEPRAVLPVDEVYADFTHRTDDLLADVERCRDELVAAGHDVIVVDQTTPEQRRLGLRTVSTLAPGLLPIDFGWPRQRALRLPRLRTAPVRAGWRGAPLREADIHRVPHPFP